jgi:hypothetical protein
MSITRKICSRWGLATVVAMGDPACFLSETCLSCGRHLDDTDEEYCVYCGEPLVRATQVDTPAGDDVGGREPS